MKQLATAIFLFALGFALATLTGCTGSLKSRIKRDLMVISVANDCPTTCALLKAYIRTQLGGL